MSTLRVHFRQFVAEYHNQVESMAIDNDSIIDEANLAMEIDDDCGEGKRVKRQQTTQTDEVTPLIDLDAAPTMASSLVSRLGLAVFASLQSFESVHVSPHLREYQYYAYFQNLLNASRFIEIISCSQQIDQVITQLKSYQQYN